jgi:5-methylcytosine-specific restriction endonuclease McrA
MYLMSADPLLFILLLLAAAVSWIWKQVVFNHRRKKRRDHYRNVYLKSDAWKRKRFVVLRRDNWKCVYCGKQATQVHHKRYAKKNIGKEPIKWLVSVRASCHGKQHG